MLLLFLVLKTKKYRQYEDQRKRKLNLGCKYKPSMRKAFFHFFAQLVVTLVLRRRYLDAKASLPWYKIEDNLLYHGAFVFLIILSILTSPTLPFGVEWSCYNSINRRSSLSINELFSLTGSSICYIIYCEHRKGRDLYGKLLHSCIPIL